MGITFSPDSYGLSTAIYNDSGLNWLLPTSTGIGTFVLCYWYRFEPGCGGAVMTIRGPEPNRHMVFQSRHSETGGVNATLTLTIGSGTGDVCTLVSTAGAVRNDGNWHIVCISIDLRLGLDQYNISDAVQVAVDVTPLNFRFPLYFSMTEDSNSITGTYVSWQNLSFAIGQDIYASIPYECVGSLSDLWFSPMGTPILPIGTPTAYTGSGTPPDGATGYFDKIASILGIAAEAHLVVIKGNPPQLCRGNPGIDGNGPFPLNNPLGLSYPNAGFYPYYTIPKNGIPAIYLKGRTYAEYMENFSGEYSLGGRGTGGYGANPIDRDSTRFLRWGTNGHISNIVFPDEEPPMDVVQSQLLAPVLKYLPRWHY